MSEGCGSMPSQQVDAVLDAYDRWVDDVYNYIFRRCRDVGLAEDLTTEVFLAVARTASRCRDGEEPAALGRPWLIGVARHKLADHWRAVDRDRRLVGRLVQRSGPNHTETLDVRSSPVFTALARLNPSQRAALVFRYLDDLPVAEVALLVGRSVASTETLLVRARRALARAYATEVGRDD